MNASASAELLKLALEMDAWRAGDDLVDSDSWAERIRALATSLSPAQVSDGGAVAWEVMSQEGKWERISKGSYDYTLKAGEYQVRELFTHPSPSGAQVVTVAMVERACAAAYNACDMGLFPQEAVLPDSDRRFVRAALAASGLAECVEACPHCGVGAQAVARRGELFCGFRISTAALPPPVLATVRNANGDTIWIVDAAELSKDSP